jgi:imidazolonepropionase-like amidohydrolase
MLTFENARVFDGHRMRSGPVSVTIDAGRVVSVGQAAAAGAERIDLAGMTLMPGMASCHLHPDNYRFEFSDFLAGVQLGKELPPGVLMAIGVRTCRVLLESGFTAYVGAACSHDIDVQLKMAVSEGIIPGPRILACGHHVGTTGDNNDPGKWWQEFRTPGINTFANGVDGMTALVRDEIRRGVEVIKVYASAGHAIPDHRGCRNMSSRELAAAVEAAHERGALIRAHVCERELIMECVELGVDIIDHADEIDEAIIERMVAKGLYWVPSLAFTKACLDLGFPDPDGSTARSYRNVQWALPLAHKAGVKILLGDDYGGQPLPHEVGIYGQELPLYAGVEGVSAADVLTWATANVGGLFARTGKVGVIEPGAAADLIVVDGDPTRDIGLLARPAETVKAVYRDGALVVNRFGPAAASRAGQPPERTLAAVS